MKSKLSSLKRSKIAKHGEINEDKRETTEVTKIRNAREI